MTIAPMPPRIYGLAHNTTVVTEALRRNVDGFICGHIHQPASKNFRGIIYKNIGDWVESCSALTENFSGSLDIVHWTDQATKMKTLQYVYESCCPAEQLAQSGC